MDLLYRNYVLTTTQFSLNTGGSTNLENVFLTDERFQYITESCDNDAIQVQMRINFDATVSISKIALKGINWKWFTIYKNGVTIVEYFLTNSNSSMYLSYTPFYATSLTFYINTTQVAHENKSLGYVVISDLVTDFGGRVPSAQKYRPILRNKKVLHELSDGSYRSQVFDKKLGCDIQLDFLSSTVKEELKEAYNSNTDFVFCPFGTTTGWDGVIFPAIWANDFEFFEVTDNNAAGGHSGSIKLLETRV